MRAQPLMAAAALAVTAGCLGAACPVLAQEARTGQQRAQACAVCHGANGISNLPDAPHLAGQPAVYLSAQLKAYRSGMRRHEVMAVIARALTDDDIAALAAWYGAIRIEAHVPQ